MNERRITVSLTVEQIKDLIFDCDWALKVSPGSVLAGAVTELQNALATDEQVEPGE